LPSVAFGGNVLIITNYVLISRSKLKAMSKKIKLPCLISKAEIKNICTKEHYVAFRLRSGKLVYLNCKVGKTKLALKYWSKCDKKELSDYMSFFPVSINSYISFKEADQFLASYIILTK
jgi:hypothetical protein